MCSVTVSLLYDYWLWQVSDRWKCDTMQTSSELINHLGKMEILHPRVSVSSVFNSQGHWSVPDCNGQVRIHSTFRVEQVVKLFLCIFEYLTYYLAACILISSHYCIHITAKMSIILCFECVKCTLNNNIMMYGDTFIDNIVSYYFSNKV